MVTLAPLARSHRARVAEILRGTAVFRDEEIDVALELFDDAIAHSAVAVDGGRRTDSVVSGVAVDGRRSTDSVVSRVAVDGGRRTDDAVPDYTFLGAFTQRFELAGFACYGPMPGTDRTYDLYWIAVDPAVAGRGVGTLLLDEVERRLRESKARMIVAETSSRDDYEQARWFYQRRGYTEAGRVCDFYARSDDRIIFTKRLALKAAGAAVPDEQLQGVG